MGKKRGRKKGVGSLFGYLMFGDNYLSPLATIKNPHRHCFKHSALGVRGSGASRSRGSGRAATTTGAEASGASPDPQGGPTHRRRQVSTGLFSSLSGVPSWPP